MNNLKSSYKIYNFMKKYSAKTLKIAVVENSTVVIWRPSAGNLREYSHKPYTARN